METDSEDHLAKLVEAAYEDGYEAAPVPGEPTRDRDADAAEFSAHPKLQEAFRTGWDAALASDAARGSRFRP